MFVPTDGGHVALLLGPIVQRQFQLTVSPRSLSHTKWQCKCHIVFIPKYRKRRLYGVVRKHLGEVFHRLAKQKECWIEEGHIMPDHVHMLINVPPKLAVSSVVGYIKGKSAIPIGVSAKTQKKVVGMAL
jgi:putative transposase